MDSVVESLDRFQIEALYAFKMAEFNRANAADIMHISPGAMYNDLVTVKERTGLNPFKPEQFAELYDALESYRKEKMDGKDINIGDYLCGK